MQHLWAPWRIKYIEDDKDEGCIFCVKPNEEQKRDKENYIVYRGRRCFCMLNLYPYNNGHMMVSPYKHVGDLEGLDDEELLELMQVVRKGTKTLKEVMSPDGFNIGINAGKAAGAGFGDHIHIHIVSRWAQDTNFMPVVSDTRVIPEALNDTYERLVKAWNLQKG